MLNIHRFFEKNYHISDDCILQQLCDCAKIEHLKRGDLLQEVGDQSYQLSFLESGILRGFVVDEDGRDITDCFSFEGGDVLMGCNGLDEASQINIEAISDCMIIQIPITVMMDVLTQSSFVLGVYNQLLCKALKRQWEIKRILYLPAMQRYQWFLSQYPGLIDSVSHKYIASFLGITPVTLSRLRRQLRG